MEIAIFAEKILFSLFFVGLLVAMGAMVVRLNNSAKRTKLLIPHYALIALVAEVVLLAGSIILVLLSKF